MKWGSWVYALLTAVIGGAANTVAAMFVDPAAFNFNDLPKLGKLLLAGATISLILFLKQSPLPPRDGNPPAAGSVASTLKLLLFCSLLSALWMLAIGCASPGGSGAGAGGTNTASISPDQVERATRLVARIGSRIAVSMAKRPELQADLEMAAGGIRILLAQGNYNPQALREALAQINVPADDNLWLVIESLMDVYTEFAGPLVNQQIDRVKYLRPILEGLEAGLSPPAATAAP